ncbi:4-hydroxy-3-methylbut-2-enyl diphosphate reductase [hydrothermal vent metagenome]|uniref:4-hydroxy-3-methylbut-2-enyl diphosphate reductase n=1 Tax=hydrothermal vent metagenome TaxID=652676 RepID=A0A3B0TE89_9ZZZZ
MLNDRDTTVTTKAASDGGTGAKPNEAPPGRRLLLAAPRGFCAGVDRAIQIVELALLTYGKPVYVRHEIVHNRHVVDALKAKGAVFVEDLDEVPQTTQPVIFSAHGVPQSVPAAARARDLHFIDATCPLVSKVHMEAARHHEDGFEVVLIGHAGHPEVIGTMGQLPDGAICLVETVEDAARFNPRDPGQLAYVTQTTLSVDDTAAVVTCLEGRFPFIRGPHKQDICYATTNRQEAVKAIAPSCDVVLVVGAPNSSNSRRLVEVAIRAGAGQAFLVQSAGEIDWPALDGASTIGLTAGASAPEALVEDIIDAISARAPVVLELVQTAKERVSFKLPRHLRHPASGTR